MNYAQPVSEFLARARTSKGLSQGAVAKHLGKDQNAVSRYERAQTPVPLDLAPKYADVLGLDSQDLIMRIAYEGVNAASGHQRKVDRFEHLLDRLALLVDRLESADLSAVDGI